MVQLKTLLKYSSFVIRNKSMRLQQSSELQFYLYFKWKSMEQTRFIPLYHLTLYCYYFISQAGKNENKTTTIDKTAKAHEFISNLLYYIR